MSKPRIIIIGAGMSGILAAIKFQQAGYQDVTILEKASRLGGTWRDNTYPGLSCDVPSHHYSYSFEFNPNWTHLFSPGAEICEYFEGVAEKYGVHSLIRFDEEVIDAKFDQSLWRLNTASGSSFEAEIVICATGPLHHPKYPDLEDLGRFEGACFHSARWDHSVPLDNQRVGIIGTGSTAIQITPAIIDRVDKLSLFQRTAQWVISLPNVPYSEEQKTQFRADPQLMSDIYEQWKGQFNHTFARAVLGDERQLGKLHELCQANLDQNVHDAELKRKLTPDYKVACKRLVMSSTFYPAIQKPNADLVTAGIERVEGAGIRTVDGELHELDVLVLATGFHAHQFMRPIRLIGRNGVTIEQAWADANAAYRSLAVPGFPNFFMLVGPNSPIGNFSLIMISELQVDYILKLAERIRAGDCQALEPGQVATDQFNADLKAAMGGTIWTSGCNSWYLDKNGTPVTWPWDFETFERDMAEPRFDDFVMS
ncbi:MAG: NAD(P)/FAD-dependent oxidoreductase [Pseudomonadota bacterium]